MALPAHLAHLDALLDLMVDAAVREIEAEAIRREPVTHPHHPDVTTHTATEEA